MGSILAPIETAVAWIMFEVHALLTAIGMPAGSGWTWGLSIVGLTMVIRTLLIPLFVRQINASRRMQLLQPELQKLQAKYKGKTDQASREAFAREQMALYRDTGTNPFSSCMPLLLQSPIFFALFNVLNHLGQMARGTHVQVGPITQDVAKQIEASSLFGAHLSDTFTNSGGSTKILCLILIILMSAATFYSQKMLMSKNMPESAMDPNNQFMQTQKMMLYIFPIVFAVSGVSFPLGVLIYWLTSNLWTAGQQFYVIHRMPAPGSQAERELNERRARKGKPPVGQPKQLKGGSHQAGATAIGSADAPAEPPKQGGQRQQPKRRDRRRSGQGTGSDAEATDGADTTDSGSDPSGKNPKPKNGKQTQG